MKKSEDKKSRWKPDSRKVLILAGVFLVLFLLVYVFRGWIRTTVIPGVVAVIQGNPAKEVFESEAKNLDNPLTLLGYKSIEREISGCGTSLANGIRTQVACSHQLQAFGEVDQASISKEQLNTNAEKLQNLLKQNGWQGEYSDNGDYMSLKKLVSNITAGIDYSPDATYQKQVGGVNCMFSTNTAFATPNPPAIATQISCYSDFNVFGKPEYN